MSPADKFEKRWEKRGRVKWRYAFKRGELHVKAFTKIVNGESRTIMPVKSDMEQLRKELLKQFGKDAVVVGTFSNNGSYDFQIVNATLN